MVHPVGPPGADSLSPALARLVPAERLADCRILEIFPEDQFVTYGIGVPLLKLRDPAAARARIPVA
ncbi:MAG TPA: hypothetical protein VFH76_22195 [Kribbella sp.]|nr:hypothetical protein [Kribbella sp.]